MRIAKVFQFVIMSCVFIGGGVGDVAAAAPTPSTTFPFTAEVTSNVTESSYAYFPFSISASGNFRINCGNGTLQRNDGTDDAPNWVYPSNQNPGSKQVQHSNTSTVKYRCRYVAGNSGKIFGLGVWDDGTINGATGYSSSPVISFKDNQNLTAIAGSLGAVFPTLGNQQPNFYQSFKDCSNLTGSIPSGLFDGISGTPTANMFQETFSGCTGLNGNVPTNLFGEITGNVSGAMQDIFENTGLNTCCASGTYKVGTNDTATFSWANYTSQWSNKVACDATATGGAVCPPDGTYKFFATTKNVSGAFDFSWDLAADGTFYVDCGDTTATLIYPDASTSSGGVGTITRNHVNESGRIPETYTCRYQNGGVKTISFGGAATAVKISGDLGDVKVTSGLMKTICFTPAADYLVGVDGSLGQIFNVQGVSFTRAFYDCEYLTTIPNNLFDGLNYSGMNLFKSTFANCSSLRFIPDGLFGTRSVSINDSFMFSGTFFGCTGLSEIPPGLFSGVNGKSIGMFSSTFSGCTGLSEIPPGLFSGVSGAVGSLFTKTFSGCTGLSEIPPGLFSGVNGAEGMMFSGTFSGCTGLSEIPPGLFSGVNGTAANMFSSTFSGCTGLSEIPPGLFGGVRGGGAIYMFSGTFSGCTGLSEIPPGLFGGVTGAANRMFAETFSGCTGLTGPIPYNLFNGVNDVAQNMFNSTFYGCTNLGKENGVSTYYIPPNLFGGVPRNAPNNMFQNVFYNTGLIQCCPAGMRKLTTNDADDYNTAAYVDSFSNRVSCIADTPPAGELTLIDGQCVENCGKQLNVKPDNAGQTKAYSMYKRAGTTIGDKTLNIKESGATDTCYVPLKSINNAPSGIQGVLRISVNGNTYYAEPAN